MAWIIFVFISYGNVWVCFRPSELVKWHAIIISQFIHALTHQLTENLFKTKHGRNQRDNLRKTQNTNVIEHKSNEKIWSQTNMSTFQVLFITRVINSCLLYVLFCIVVMFVYCFNTVSVLLCCVFFFTLVSFAEIYLFMQRTKIHISTTAHRQEHWWEAPTKHAFDTLISNLSFRFAMIDWREYNTILKWKRQTGNRGNNNTITRADPNENY